MPPPGAGGMFKEMLESDLPRKKPARVLQSRCEVSDILFGDASASPHAEWRHRRQPDCRLWAGVSLGAGLFPCFSFIKWAGRSSTQPRLSSASCEVSLSDPPREGGVISVDT